MYAYILYQYYQYYMYYFISLGRKSAHCTLQLFRKEVTNCRIKISLSKENLTRNMMNTSRAPLAESEDFDNLSMKSLGNSAPLPNHFPDQNHNDVRKPDSSRKRIPPTTNNNSKTPVAVTRPFPNNVENFPDERDHVSFCNPALMLGAIYCCGAMFFLIGMNVEGLTLLRYPWIGNLLNSSYQNLDFYNGVIILQVMWCVHFVRKSIQVLFMNRYHGQIAGVLFMCMLLYYSLFGLWVGWSMNFYLRYYVPKVIFLIPGVFLYLVGEFGSFYCHWLLRNTRVQPSGILVPRASGLNPNLPDSILFKYGTYPQFIFELLSFVGFYLSSHTVAAGAFLLATLIYIISLTLISHFQMKRNYWPVNNG